jgi:hypothetical protein
VQAAASPSVLGASALIASTLIAGTPVASPPELHLVSDAAVRLTSAASDALDALLSGLIGGTPVTSLSDLTGDLTTINDSLGLTSLITDLNNLSDLTGLSNLPSELTDLGNLLSGINLDGLQNIPYNLFADIVNIPYYESEALQEYAFALSPGGSVGGVAGWIPPGATVADGGVDVINGQDYFALGGTGSWYMESVGNTWGWDDGNWPQVDGLVHFLLPFQFTEGINEQVEGLLQAESIDGAGVDCEFECANLLGNATVPGYLEQWFHVPLQDLLDGYTYPTVLADTVGSTSATGVINAGGTAGEDVIWSGQNFTLDPTLGLDSIWTNLTSSPADDPIQFPSLDSLLLNSELLTYLMNYDFNPFVEGSFIYWGAPTLYSVPAALGGLVNELTDGLIPNEFALPNDGAEPLSGYTTTISDLLPGLQQGFQYLANGLEEYLNPATYGASAADASTLLGSLGDSTALASDLSSVLSTAGTDLSSLLGTELGTNFSTLLSDLATSLVP